MCYIRYILLPMRLFLLVFFLFPFTAFGQISSDLVLESSTLNSGIQQNFTPTVFHDTPSAGVKFGLRKEPASVKIHPNPSSMDLYVTLTGSGEVGKVIVYDILGNIIVRGESFRLHGGSSSWSHDVSTWHPGTYVVRVLQDGSVVKSLRFIKN